MEIWIRKALELMPNLDRYAQGRDLDDYIPRFFRKARQQHRWNLIESSLGTIEDRGHGWDQDLARWVREQRRNSRER